MEMLRVDLLSKRFGSLTAVDSCSFSVNQGEIVGVMGPNGAGKTTLLNLISGFYKPDSGEIWFNGRRIDGLPPYKIAKLGIGRTFQVSRVFPTLSVIENVRIGVEAKFNDTWRDRAFKALELVGLEKMVDRLAGQLSGGQLKLLEFATVAAGDPTLYLLDEPFAALHPSMRERLSEIVLDLSKAGKSFVIVSHEIPSLMSIAQRVIVMNLGKIISEGSPEEVRRDVKVIEAYLGGVSGA